METNESLLGVWLPLPYRVILLLILGVWLFGLNLHYLLIVRIEVGPMIRYTRSLNEPQLHRSVYAVASVLSLLFAINIVVFWMFTGRKPEMVRQWEIFPLILALMCAGTVLWPIGGWHKRGRWRFLRMLQRVLIGGISTDLRFADILLADVLTSYAKVLGDAAVCMCMFLSGHSSTNPAPNRHCGNAYLAPCVMVLPYLARLRQCVTEYLRARRKGLPAMDRQPHILNAAKYASAFPVIVCSALQRNYDPTQPNYFSQMTLSRTWLCAVVFNSCFSFYWDVARDWGLTLFEGRRGLDEHSYGLRKHRYFVANEFYYAAIGIDFLLRATWSVKLSPHLDNFDAMEGGIWCLELLEVFRRWVWVFFRVEKEWIITSKGNSGISGGLGLLVDAEEGIMLNEYED